MPLEFLDEINKPSPSAGYMTIPEDPTPAAGPDFLRALLDPKTFQSAFRQGNTVGSVINRVPGMPVMGQAPDLKFDQFALIPEDKRIYAKRYYNANTPAEVEAVSRQIDMELDDKQTLAGAGWAGVAAGIGAGILDPINLIPVGGSVVKAKGLTSVLKGAMFSGAVGLGSMSLTEAALHASQVTRTPEETAYSLAGATFLSGLAGGLHNASGQMWDNVVYNQTAKHLMDYAPQVEKDLSIPKIGRYNREEAEHFLEIYGKAEGHLDDLKEKNLPADNPELMEAKRQYEAAKEKWESVVADVHENDFLEPGGIEISPEALSRDTGTSVLLEGADGAVHFDKPGGGKKRQPRESKKEPVLENLTAAEAQARVGERLKDDKLLSRLPLLNKQDPLIRSMLSHSIETRRIVQMLAESPLKYAKNALGVATTVPVEALIKQTKAPLAFSLKHLDEMFEEYRFGKSGAMGKLRAEAGDLINQAGEKLTYQEFKEEVGKAMRNGDYHEIPQVANAAKRFRQDVFDPLKERAIALKALPEDIEPSTAFSYLTRVWDVPKIIANRDEFFQANLQWLKEKEAAKALAASEAGEQFTPRTIRQLEDVVDRLIDRVVGTPEGRLSYERTIDIDPDSGLKVASIDGSLSKPGGEGLAKPLHKRVYDIPDKRVENFLVSDIEHVAKIYERTMSADLTLMEQFGKNTDLGEVLETLRSRIAKDYDTKLRTAKTPKERQALEGMKQQDLTDITAVFHRLRGTYGLPQDPSSTFVRMGRVARSLNYLALMGGVTISSIPDLARPMMVHGLKRYLGDGLLPLVTNFKAFRASAAELKLAGTALDMILDSRTMSMGELFDDFGRGNKFERLLGGLQEGYGTASGISPWTATMKQLAGMMTQSRIIQATLDSAAGKIAKKEIQNLANSYIDSGMAKRIAQQFEKYGDTQGTVRLANTEDWVDREAVQVFRAAIAKDVDRIVVTPGMDKPLWLSNEWGKLFGQFKSFFFASTQRVLMAGMQDRDLGVLHGLTFATSLGVLTTLMQAKLANRKLETYANSPEDLILEGLDRTGAAGWLFEVNGMVEKLTRGHVGLSAATGKQPMSRYASRNVIDALLGPTAGRIADMAKVTGTTSQALFPSGNEVGKNPWTEGDTRAMRRLLPFQNLFYLRSLFDAAEDNLQGILGVEPKTGEKSE